MDVLHAVINVTRTRKARGGITDTTNHMHADQPASTHGLRPPETTLPIDILEMRNHILPGGLKATAPRRWDASLRTYAVRWRLFSPPKRDRGNDVTELRPWMSLGRGTSGCTVWGYGAHPVMVGCPSYPVVQSGTGAIRCRFGGRGGWACDRRPLRIGTHCGFAVVSIPTVVVDIAGRHAKRTRGPAATGPRATHLQGVQAVRDWWAAQICGYRANSAWRRFSGTHRQRLAGSACGAGRAGPPGCAGYLSHRSRCFDKVLLSSSLTGQHQAVVLCRDSR